VGVATCTMFTPSIICALSILSFHMDFADEAYSYGLVNQECKRVIGAPASLF